MSTYMKDKPCKAWVREVVVSREQETHFQKIVFYHGKNRSSTRTWYWRIAKLQMLNTLLYRQKPCRKGIPQTYLNISIISFFEKMKCFSFNSTQPKKKTRRHINRTTRWLLHMKDVICTMHYVDTGHLSAPVCRWSSIWRLWMFHYLPVSAKRREIQVRGYTYNKHTLIKRVGRSLRFSVSSMSQELAPLSHR